jgi:hypothetical protein
MKIIVLPHQGLGDQLVMNGYINYLASDPDIESITLIARSYQKRTLEHLYEDTPKVIFSWDIHESESVAYVETKNILMKRVNGMRFGDMITINDEPFIVHTFGFHSTIHSFVVPGRNWVDSFYLRANVDPSLRYSMFKIPKNMLKSKSLYESLIEFLGGTKYVLIHDDPSRQRFITADLVKKELARNGTRHLPALYLGKNRYNFPLIEGLNNIKLPEFFITESLLDLYDTIYNATECHLMNSSISILTDTMNNSNTKLYVHHYMTEDKGASLVTNTIECNRTWTAFH